MANDQQQQSDIDIRDIPTAASGDACLHVDWQSATVDEELMKALRNGDKKKIMELESGEPHVFNVLTPQGNTVLHLASRFREESVVQEILRIKPSLLSEKNRKGETAMHIAATVGDDGVIKLLLDKMTAETVAEDILGMEDNDGNTPLQNAVKNDHSSVVRALLEREHACADIVKNFLGAISRRDFDLMDLIFKAKKEVVNMLDMEQKNFLFQYAADSDHVEIIRLLLEADASLASQCNRDDQTHLHCAAASGHVEIARLLLKANASLASQCDRDGQTPLHCAAAYGHVEIARHLLSENGSLAYQGNRDGQTPLHCAAASGHVEIALHLLTEQYASLAYQGDHYGQTPLHLAVKNDRLNVLRTILRYCPDATDVLDNSHHNILHLAAQCGNLDIVSFIIESPGMETLINSPDENGNTPLHLASMFSHSDVAKILFRNAKVNIKITNHNNKTPLDVFDTSTYPGKILQKEMIMMTDMIKAASSKTALVDSKRDSYQELIKAIRRGDWFKIRNLANRENDPSPFMERSPEGNTVLHIAARYGNWLVVNEILDYNVANVSLMIHEKNHKGETPMHIAAKYGNAVTVFLLVCDGYMEDDDLYFDEERNTPLHNAVRHGHEISAEILIEHGPNLILEKNKAGQSPVAIAIDAKLNYITRILIQHKPSSLDYEGPEQLTLLHSAIIHQDYDIMLQILKQKPELINKPDANGRNPLHYAAASDHVKMARRLSKEKPSLVYQSDIKGQKPLHLAAKNGQPNVLKMLLRHYPDAIELTDENGQNVLHIAAQNGKVKIVSFILKLREMVDLVNSRDKNGNTPLHLATREFQNDVVYILCKNMNVNIRETNKSGKTALQIVETSTLKGKDIQKHLSTRALKAAYADRGLDAEDIKTHVEEHGPEPKKDAEDNKAQDEEQGTEAKKKADEENRHLVRNEDMEGENGKGKDMARTLTVKNTLIATFTFTAAFTIPGGFRSSGDRDEGVAVLGKRTGFQAFVITDTIAMTSSMTAAVTVFWSFWRSKNESFMDALPMAIGLTWIGLVSMILAFVTGLYVVLSDNMALAIAVSSIGCTLPLIFYVFAPIISLLYNPSANVNPLAFTFSMIKIFLNKPIGWCFRWIHWMLKCMNISHNMINRNNTERIDESAKKRFILLIIVGGIYYLIKACLITLSDWCFHRESEGTESKGQTPTDPSNGRFLRKSTGNESNDQPPVDPQRNV